MTKLEFLELFNDIELSKVSYEKIMSIIKFNSIQIPITTTLIKKGSIIQRGRINKDNEIFTSEFDISYRTDYGNIKEFGRANRPVQSRFYGAMPSEKIKHPLFVLFAEIVEQFNLIPKDNYKTTITIGSWEVLEDFEVADICFSDKYLINNEMKQKVELWKNKIQNTELIKTENINLLKYFSNEFAKTEIKNHYDYKMSCIYSELVTMEGLNGVLYPSVKTEYNANNISLIPSAVEKYLNLKNVGMFDYIVNNGVPKVIQTNYTDKFGSLNSKFTWENK